MATLPSASSACDERDVRRVVREEFARCWSQVDSDGRFNPTIEAPEPDTPPQGGLCNSVEPTATGQTASIVGRRFGEVR